MFGRMKSILKRLFTKPTPATLTLTLQSKSFAVSGRKSRPVRIEPKLCVDATGKVYMVRHPVEIEP